MSATILRGGTIVARLHPPEVVVGDVLVADGRVVATGADARADLIAPPDPRAAGAYVVDCSGCLVIPGNVNAHTHAYSALARGMPYRLEPPRTFVEILRRIWWRLDRALDEGLIRASARVTAMEALLAGTTTIVDHHASPRAIDGSLDVLAEELERLGLRSILAYETSDRDGSDAAASGVAENRRFIARVDRARPALVRGLVGAHASFTLSDATLAACVDLAGGSGRGLHIHVAEDADDERDAVARHGLRVAERLARAGALVPGALLAHGVHLDPTEAALVRGSGVTLAHNPRSNMNNGVGRAPLALLGPRVALGTDGIGSDLFEESRIGHLRHLEERDAAGGFREPDSRRADDAGASDAGSSDAGSSDASWPLARLAAGARFVGEAFDEPLLGSIVPGAPADLVVLDYPAPAPVTAATLAGHWTFGLSARAVRDVLVDGRVVVRDRRLTLADQDRLAADARDEATRLWRRLDAMGEHPFAPTAVLVS